MLDETDLFLFVSLVKNFKIKFAAKILLTKASA